MKTIFGVSTRFLLTLAAPAALVLSLPAAGLAQTATLHGKITNPAGQAQNHGDVKLTTDKDPAHTDRSYPYTFPISSTGTYSGEKIVPGDYRAIVFADGKTVDYLDLAIKAGDNDTLDFDMTRPEYIKQMKPEDLALLEEYKKKNAAVNAENSKIANLNAVLEQARKDEKAGDAAVAVTALQGLTQQKADEPVIWASLGEAQLAVADAAVKAARDAKQSTNTPDIQAKYTDSAASYQKALDLNASSKKPNPALAASSELNIGTALAKAGKMKEANEAFDAAVKINPASAAMAYDNEAAILFNMNKLDEAASVADKAIAADPKKAINYYIKGQALIPKATVDPKTQKYVLPPGCLEAYQEYLELAPDGQFANDVKQLLAGLGQPIVNGFKTKKH